MKPTWIKYLLYGSVTIVGGALAFILIETTRLRNTGFEGKSLWDWMELLIIPLVLAGGALLLNRSERNNEREITADRQREAALQSYLDRMSDLLLKEKLRTTRDKEVRNIARIRTLTVLRRLDGSRKGIVLRFLQEAKLLTKEKNIVDLTGADLRGADLSDADLSNANLNSVDLSNASLVGANLNGVDLAGASLNGAILNGAQMDDANLNSAWLEGARLRKVSLKRADLRSAILTSVSFIMADLSNARLNESYLNGADLRSALVTNKQLADANSFHDARLPDGTKHD